MPVRPHTLFISDVHLSAALPGRTARFLDFMVRVVPGAHALYILGDLFDIWLGPDYEAALHRRVGAALSCAVRAGTPVYFMPGNHDFLMHRAHPMLRGCQWLADPACIMLYGRPTVLTHGDSLCTADHWHQWFRRWAYRAWVKRLFLGLPLSVRCAIAQRFQRPGRVAAGGLGKPAAVLPQAVSMARLLQAHQADQLIHGHTHQPQIGTLSDPAQARHIVLGDWSHCTPILRYHAQGGVVYQ